MKQILLMTAALLAGFAGGVLGSRVTRPSDQPRSERLVRARSFELLDEAGNAISFWGEDKGKNAVLAFGSHWPATSTGGGNPSANRHLRLEDSINQRVTIGVIDDSPFLDFRAPDGKTLVSLYLSLYGKPTLLMGDETGPRISLGIEQSDTPGPGDNDWTLYFAPERARIGMRSQKVGGQTYVRGILSVQDGKVTFP